MTQQPKHLAIVAGVVAAAAMSISGTLASPRTDAASTHSLPTGISAIPDGLRSVPNPALPPLRDLQAIKRSQIPLASLRRNPFHIGTAPTAAAPLQEATRGQLLSALSALRLQSVLCSDLSRGCTINGKAVIEGDAIGGFTVEKINSNSVALKSGVYRFELRVQQ